MKTPWTDEEPQRLLARTRILVRRGWAEDYNRAQVAASTLGGIGPMVFYYTGNLNDRPVTPSGLSVDRVLLRADEHTRI
jgi:hypothetical protein